VGEENEIERKGSLSLIPLSFHLSIYSFIHFLTNELLGMRIKKYNRRKRRSENVRKINAPKREEEGQQINE
jgi:hypothetical protein